MVRPRFSFGSVVQEPKEIFVNRVDAISLFEQMRDAIVGSGECRILNYYGVGGIGKSALRKEIERSHLGEDTITFSMNCRNHTDIGAGDSLIALVDSCTCSKKVKFPLFEIAYAGYFSKRHPDMESGRKRKQFSDRFKIGLDILSIVDGGISNFVTGLVDISYDAINRALIPKEIKADLDKFPSYSLFDLELRLPAYFAADLKNISEEFGLSPLFIIDTFEAVNEHESRKERCFANEKWMRDIIASTYEGLAVVFSRDPIDWGADWDGLITKFQLQPLNEIHSSTLLERGGVSDVNVKSLFLEMARGFPLYLTLLVDTYRLDPQPADVLRLALAENAQIDKRILNRFFYNLTDSEAETLRVLSLANYFTRELLEFIVCRFNIGFPFTHFEEFVSYSFIEPSGNSYFIQRNVRDIVGSSVSQNLASRAHQAFSDYYESEFESDGQYEHLYQLAFHRASYLDSESLLEWVTTVVCPIIDAWRTRGERRKIYDLLQMLLETLDFDSLGASLLGSYTDIVHLGGDYQRSVELIDDYLSRNGIDQLGEQAILYLKTRKLHHAMFYESATDLLSEAIGLRESCNLSASDALVELDFLIGGNLSVLAGDFAAAEKWLTVAQIDGIACETANIQARIDRKLADISLVQEDFFGALSILEPYMQLESKSSGHLTRYEVYLLGSIGEYYRSVGECKLAESYFGKLLSVTQEKGMPGWEAHAFLALAVLYTQMNRVDDAVFFAKSAYELYEQSQHCWGLANVAIVLDAISSHSGYVHYFASGRTPREEAEFLCREMSYSYQANFIGTEDLSSFHLLFL